MRSNGAFLPLDIGPMPPFGDTQHDIGPSTAVLGPVASTATVSFELSSL